jgi:hypothetical protein
VEVLRSDLCHREGDSKQTSTGNSGWCWSRRIKAKYVSAKIWVVAMAKLAPKNNA